MTINSTANVPMHLPLSTSEPDSLGFGQVSGFYGPGAWAAWYLTLCASWFRLGAEPSGFDPNTWLFLSGLNWSAVDMIRQLNALANLRDRGDDAWMKHAASVGAAENVAVWGLLHCLTQFGIVYKTVDPKNSLQDMQRALTLIVGSIIPLGALTISPWLLNDVGGQVSSKIPALYWDGMLVSDNRSKHGRYSIDTGHDVALYVFAVLGPWMLILYLRLGYKLFKETHFGERVIEIVSGILARLTLPVRWVVRRAPGSTRLGLFVISLVTFYVLCAAFRVDAVWYFAPIWVPFLVVGLIIAPFSVLYQLFGLACAYIFSAYFHLGDASISKSCFFMPCAPQSISEMDQASALFAGLFSLVIVEIGVPLFKKRKKENERTRADLQNASDMIEMARMRGSAQQTSQGTATTIDSRANPSALEATSHNFQPPSRVNSGIAAEEGRAGQWRLSRVNSAREGINALRRTETA